MGDGKTLGGLVSSIRRSRNWTLKQMSEVVGIPLSTLAKVEGDKLSLSYDKIQSLAYHLGMPIADFFAHADSQDHSVNMVTARRSLSGTGNSVTIETQNYRYEYLCSDLSHKLMVPIITEVKARTLAEFGEPVSHPGQEFIFVLEGEVEVHLEFYTPTVVKRGEGIYIDSEMEHAYVAHNCRRAVLLGVCAGDSLDLQSTLLDLAEKAREEV